MLNIKFKSRKGIYFGVGELWLNDRETAHILILSFIKCDSHSQHSMGQKWHSWHFLGYGIIASQCDLPLPGKNSILNGHISRIVSICQNCVFHWNTLSQVNNAPHWFLSSISLVRKHLWTEVTWPGRRTTRNHKKPSPMMSQLRGNFKVKGESCRNW